MNEVERYIESFPENVRLILSDMRKLVAEVAPDSAESFAYGMPAYKLNGKPLVYFAAFKAHIGLYATPSGHAKFAEELVSYKQGKGSVQFPLDRPMPYDLIRRIVAFRAEENRSIGKRR